MEGSIADQIVEAVVNAAAPDLRGGQGVDGAIHSLGGPAILEECRRIGGCPIGDAVLTGAGGLSARYVIHAVGPEYNGEIDNGRPEADLLECTYRSALRLTREYAITSVAFPAISTGAFCFPFRRATGIAVSTVIAFLNAEPHCLELVRFVVYKKECPAAYSIYCEVVTSLLGPDCLSGVWKGSVGA